MKTQRDKNILLSYKKEINLNTKCTKNKKVYNRKRKHKNKETLKSLENKIFQSFFI
jgi:hypothetical protein